MELLFPGGTEHTELGSELAVPPCVGRQVSRHRGLGCTEGDGHERVSPMRRAGWEGEKGFECRAS